LQISDDIQAELKQVKYEPASFVYFADNYRVLQCNSSLAVAISQNRMEQLCKSSLKYLFKNGRSLAGQSSTSSTCWYPWYWDPCCSKNWIWHTK